MSVGTLVLILVLLVVVAVAVVKVARRHLIVVTVEGLSMQPEYQPGDRVLVHRKGRPRRGDVAVLEQPDLEYPEWAVHLAILGDGRPTTGQRWMIKRVTGIPGDLWQSQPGEEEEPIPEGHFYLLGDNLEHSLDSRRIGLVSAERVLGTVWKRL